MYRNKLIRIYFTRGGKAVADYAKAYRLSFLKFIYDDPIPLEDLRSVSKNYYIPYVKDSITYYLPILFKGIGYDQLSKCDPKFFSIIVTAFSLDRFIYYNKTLNIVDEDLDLIINKSISNMDFLSKYSNEISLFFDRFFKGKDLNQVQFINSTSMSSSGIPLIFSGIFENMHTVDELVTILNDLKVNFNLDFSKQFIKWEGKSMLFTDNLKVVAIPDKGFKKRLICQGSFNLQTKLKPYNDVFMSMLSFISSDRTYNQISYNNKPFNSCTDLTQATDTFAMFEMIKAINNKELNKFISIYNEYSSSINISKPYANGIPMGIYGSWSLFSLFHHFIVWIAYCESYSYISLDKFVHIKDLYLLLGDDIVIFDKKIAIKYQELMKYCGCSFSKAKTYTSSHGYEFAKTFIYKGMDISPLPISSCFDLMEDPFDFINNLFSIKRNFFFKNDVFKVLQFVYFSLVSYTRIKFKWRIEEKPIFQGRMDELFPHMANFKMFFEKFKKFDHPYTKMLGLVLFGKYFIDKDIFIEIINKEITTKFDPEKLWDYQTELVANEQLPSLTKTLVREHNLFISRFKSENRYFNALLTEQYVQLSDWYNEIYNRYQNHEEMPMHKPFLYTSFFDLFNITKEKYDPKMKRYSYLRRNTLELKDHYKHLSSAIQKVNTFPRILSGIYSSRTQYFLEFSRLPGFV